MMQDDGCVNTCVIACRFEKLPQLAKQSSKPKSNKHAAQHYNLAGSTTFTVYQLSDLWCVAARSFMD